MSFRDLKLSTKQRIAFGVLVLLLASANAFAVFRMARLKANIDEVSTYWLPRNTVVSDISESVLQLRMTQLQYAFAVDEELKQTVAEAQIAAIDSIVAYLDRYNTLRIDSLARALSDEEDRLRARESSLYQSFDNDWDRYLEESFRFLNLADSARVEEAIAVLNENAEDNYVDLRSDLDDLVALNSTAWELAARRADRDFRASRIVTLLMLISTILFSLFVADALARFIVGPIRALEKAAGQIARGERAVQLAVRQDDEVGSLARSFNRMADALKAHEQKLQQQQANLELANTELQEKTDVLATQKSDLEDALARLREAQEQLIVREKLASLGQLTAGIAHEIKNPLNFVNNFALLSADLADELEEELATNVEERVADVLDRIRDVIEDLKSNAKRIRDHGTRADGIVKGMLLHSRGTSNERIRTDLNHLVDEYVNLAYHGMRATDQSFNANIERQFDPQVGEMWIVPQDIGRVLINILNNAFYAVRERARAEKGPYKPEVGIETAVLDGLVEVRIRDNGRGVPADVRERIFEPFFSTKPTGQGTGLGLSLSYEIVTRGHGGELDLGSSDGDGATFVIRLPR